MLVVALVGVSSAAYAATGGHTVPISDDVDLVIPTPTVVTSVETSTQVMTNISTVVQNSVAATVSSTTITTTTAQELVYTVYSSVTTSTSVVSTVILSSLTTQTTTVGGSVNAVTSMTQSSLVSGLTKTNTTSTTPATTVTIDQSIVLILRNYVAVTSGDATAIKAIKALDDESAVTEFTYVASTDVGEKQFTFLSNSGDVLPALSGADDANLVVHVEDGGLYDLDGEKNGSVQIEPILARAEEVVEEPTDPVNTRASSGGGCDAGLGLFALFAVAGGLLLRKQGV
ncbi:MAG: hypothetical protein LBJ36_06450 [Synergistaceae bacterium]|nr:hypothetical protein [Synergistaceae bacterium]